MKKLAIITTHPIQYNAPVFKLLSERERLQIKVFYTWERSSQGIYDKKFGQQIQWDIPLLQGYEYQFVKNVSFDAGTHHFFGMINPGLNREIVNWKADAVLIYGWNFYSHYNAMRYFKGKIPVFFRGDSTLIDKQKGYKLYVKNRWLNWIYQHIDHAFYVGTHNKNYFLAYGLKNDQLIFAPHAIDNDRFEDINEEQKQEKQRWKAELNIKEDDMVFLFAGKFEPKKNPEIFVHAANCLKKENFKFILAGDGILKDKLKTEAENNPNIIFLPFQNQTKMPVLYRLADVFVLPSCGPYETWGLAVNEAMACKKAVIVSDKAGCAVDLVQQDKNGYIFNSNNPDQLIEKIKRFDKKTAIEFGNRSLEQIKNFSFSVLVSTIETSVNRLVFSPVNSEKSNPA